MSTERQYVVPVLEENGETQSRVNILVQPLEYLCDEHGNLKDCGFGRVENEWLGRFYVFQSLSKTTAEMVRDVLTHDESLTVLPIREVDYQP